jgi:NAD(P)-dependent dehydrogenase (short-subunit alcohol dehydrogenase family)
MRLKHPEEPRMATVFMTGSSDGLGRAAAQSLLDGGHKVVLHARSADRAAALGEFAKRSVGMVVGDLSSATETRSIADQVNAIGRMDAIIHNAGVYTQQSRGSTPEGHAATLAINTLATALIERPARLVYLNSGLHRGGEGSLADLDWTTRTWDSAKAYAESKLHVVALASALARRWPQVLSNAVDPGWARTKIFARSDRMASEGHRERVGVCRDFAHLAVALCRCMNIPARYCTGYLGDIGVPPDPAPMDFSAWFEAYIGGRWYTFDARHNHPRIGRVVIARGRDAADVAVAISTAFGPTQLVRFNVLTEEVPVDEAFSLQPSIGVQQNGASGPTRFTQVAV